MKHDILDNHLNIGIDIDQTLIDGPHSYFLQDYIRHYQGVKKFHLITFRYGYEFKNIERDLSYRSVDINLFETINGIPEGWGKKYHLMSLAIRNALNNKNLKKVDRILSYHKMTNEEFMDLKIRVDRWKGFRCKELNCTAMVDDLRDFVEPGCIHYGVDFVDSLTLLNA